VKEDLTAGGGEKEIKSRARERDERTCDMEVRWVMNVSI